MSTTFDETECREIVCCDEPIFAYSSERPPPVPPTPPPCIGPTITVQPQSVSVLAGAPILLVVFATGAYSFQWKKDGVDIPGANNNSYLIPVTTEEDSGAYTVSIGGIDGTCSTLSAEAEVMVSSPDNPCEHFEITTDSDLGTVFQNSTVNIALTATGGVSPYT